jgi:hypothetical protein
LQGRKIKPSRHRRENLIIEEEGRDGEIEDNRKEIMGEERKLKVEEEGRDGERKER